MRRLLPLFVLVLLLSAVDASAQCFECDNQYGCWQCFHTYYNAWIQCRITYNGYGCELEGQCTGQLGDRCQDGGRCIEYDHALLRPQQQPLKLRGEWKLVEVRITRAEKRRS